MQPPHGARLLPITGNLCPVTLKNATFAPIKPLRRIFRKLPEYLCTRRKTPANHGISISRFLNYPS